MNPSKDKSQDNRVPETAVGVEDHGKTRKPRNRKKKTVIPAEESTVQEINNKYYEIKAKKGEWTKTRTWGNALQRSNKWPNINEDRTIRLYFQNLKGISYYNEYIEMEMLLEYLNEMQVDIAGLTEINLDLRNPTVRHKLISKGKKMDRHIKMTLSSSKFKGKGMQTDFKMGGTMTLTRGNWSGRIIKAGCDKLGRWTYQVFTGKNGKRLKVITMYRVGKKSAVNEKCTIRLQQEQDILNETGKLKDPRDEILKDLEKQINADQEKGMQVILGGDINEYINSINIQNFQEATGMYNTLIELHGNEQPNTHDRGTKPIDIILATQNIPKKAIKRGGILPLYYGYPSDHRALYIDIDIDHIFTNQYADTTRSVYKRFSTDKTKKTDKYLFNLECMMEEARIFNKVDILEDEINKLIHKDIGNREEIIARCQKLFSKTTQLMLASERKLGRLHYPTGYPSSQKLKDAASKVIEIKKQLRQCSTDTEKMRRTLIPVN